MKKEINKVIEFNEAYNLPVRTKPCFISREERRLQLKLIYEELEEYNEASRTDNMIGIADGLGDAAYTLFGLFIKHGLQDLMVEIFNEIHRSNMSKLGKDGKPIYREDGKVLKGEDYFKPDIKSILEDG